MAQPSNRRIDLETMLQSQENQQYAPDRTPTHGAESDRSDHGRFGLYVAGEPKAFEGLVSALNTEHFQRHDELDAIVDGLAQNSSARSVIMYPNPVMVLGEKLQAGETLDEAIEDWRAETERLLAVFRRDRRRITLVDGHAALNTPDQFWRQLAARLPIALSADHFEQSAPELQPAGVPHLVVAQALRQDEGAAMLIAELEASSLSLGPAYRVDVDALVGQGVAGVSSSELDEVREENELLLLQLHQVQEELEAHFLENRKYSGRLDEVRAEADKARVDADKARAEAEKARLARNSLQAEFNEAREAWSQERKALTDKLSWTTNDLAAVRRSLSWKLTAPVRRVAGLFIGDSKL